MLAHRPHNTLSHVCARLSLALVGRGIQSACRIDPRLIRETNEFPEGALVSFIIEPDGLQLCMRKYGNRFEHVSTAIHRTSLQGQTSFTGIITFRMRSFNEFKDLMCGRLSIPQAIAEGRIITEGPAALACRFLRIVNATLIYLYPRWVATRLVKRYQRPTRFLTKRIRLFALLPFQKQGVSDDDQ